MENKQLLTAMALIALSVTALETELTSAEYPVDVLKEAIAAEQAKTEPRKTALEALCAAKDRAEAKALADAAAAQMDQDAKDKASKIANGDVSFTVAPGKSITSKRGILCGGEPISAADLSGGDEAFTVLLDKGYITQ